TFSADGKFAYAVSPQDGAVAVFAAQSGGALALVQILQQGFGGIDGLGGAAALALSADGKCLLVVSPVQNAIAVFARDASSGLLAARLSDGSVQIFRDGVGGVSGIAGPVAIVLAPGNLYVAGQADDAIAVFARDADTGALTFLQSVQNGNGGVRGLGGVTSV